MRRASDPLRRGLCDLRRRSRSPSLAEAPIGAATPLAAGPHTGACAPTLSAPPHPLQIGLRPPAAQDHRRVCSANERPACRAGRLWGLAGARSCLQRIRRGVRGIPDRSRPRVRHAPTPLDVAGLSYGRGSRCCGGHPRAPGPHGGPAWALPCPVVWRTWLSPDPSLRAREGPRAHRNARGPVVGDHRFERYSIGTRYPRGRRRWGRS